MPKTILIAIAFVLGFLAGKLLGSPADEVRAAVADLQANVRQADQPYTRYLSLHGIPAGERKQVRAVASFVLNSVGQSATIQETGGPDELIRVNLAAFGISTAAWEALAGTDPYYHQKVQVIDPATKKLATVYTDGGWVGLDQARRLAEMTRSGGAVLRADFFIAKVLTPPFYYGFSGVPKTLNEFYATLAVDGKTQLALRANKGASILRSGVTHKPRRISRWQGPLGPSWVTYDSREDGDPLKNPVRVPGFEFKHDASEHIAAKANGLHVFALFDAKGNRQDEVPPDIAHDSTAIGNDQRLRAGVSCIRCHTERGYRSFDNDFATLVEKGKANLHLPAEQAEYIAAFNDVERLKVLLERDREDYETAVKRATGGMKSEELAKALTVIYAAYEFDQVDEEVMKRELGIVSTERLKATTDPIVLALLSDFRVNRKDWELSFGGAALLTSDAR